MMRFSFLLPLFLGLGLGVGVGYVWNDYKKQTASPSPLTQSPPPPIFIKNSVAAIITKVRDGDTFEVTAFLWHGLEKNAVIRLNGINTPEKRKRRGCRVCPNEKKLAAKATNFAKKLIGKNARGRFRKIYLSNISGGQYDRYIADITTADGQDLGQALVEQNLAKPHDGSTKACWCGRN